MEEQIFNMHTLNEVFVDFKNHVIHIPYNIDKSKLEIIKKWVKATPYFQVQYTNII